MKQRLQSKWSFYIMTGCSMLYIVLGILLVSTAFDTYHKHVRENVDSQLLQFTESVDRSLESYLGRYMHNLSHSSEYEKIREAEDHWMETGDPQLWKENIKTSLLGPSEGFTDVLLMKEENILVSFRGRENYYFPKQEERKSGMMIRPCLDKEGNVYLAFIKETRNEINYAALVDMRELYQKVAGEQGDLRGNQVMLRDLYDQMFICQRNVVVHIDRISDISENTPEYPAFAFIGEQQEKKEQGTLFYEGTSYRTGEQYNARMFTIPAEKSGNGYFSVGVSINYDQEVMPLKMAAIRMAVAGIIVLIGMITLFLFLMKTMEKSKNSLKEIQILQEKNAAMEELNRQTRELAHHQRLEIMGMLTSGIAHEFNNMLTPIMGYSMMILEKLPEEESELYDEVLEIYQMSSKAKNVISRLSDLSRKNTETVFKRIRVDELVRRMISAAKSARPNEVDVQLELKCPEVSVYGNETQLSQLLLNLIINSYHALEENGGTLEILTDAEEEEIHIHVKDNGYGISSENLPHIFEPFFTTKETGKGTGLGMAIVAQVVEDHQGSIRVDSKQGEGTEITVSFPIMKKEKEKS